MNSCIFIGRLGNDPELSQVGTTNVVNFSLAIEEFRKDSTTGEKIKRVDFFNFEAWDTGATTIAKFCKKGDMLAVECVARDQHYEIEENGKKLKRSKVNFRVTKFQLLSNRVQTTPQD